MKKTAFNTGWICWRADQPETANAVKLPHDAMQMDEKSENSKSGVHSGWYEVYDYVYEKKFMVPQEWRDTLTFLEFEGIYRNAVIFVNGKEIFSHEYGYTGFYVPLSEALCYGMENRITVKVKNSDQPNSRWYSGTGIYRPVWLYHLPKKHIVLDGVRITTLDSKNPKIAVEVETTGDGELVIEIQKEQKVLKKICGSVQQNHFYTEIELPGASCWSVIQPNLYQCRVLFEADERIESFGIREISWKETEGFCINGERVILKGACIHHDNGLLGARAYDFSEYRKVKLLKKNGFNAIRSAHNPCSKAMLRACDELGVLVLDEYVDVWYIHKTKYDYAGKIVQNYRSDLEDMVRKDYNHPSVIMYSIGNEVSETAQKQGIELCEKMTDWLHELDSTRPVTCGINIFFNFLSSIGLGVYSDEKAEKVTGKNKKVGSEFFNHLAGILGADFMKFGATLYPCDLKTKDAFQKLDIAGYNYGINRYRHDLKKYPKRLILGSETFCSDAGRFFEMAKENKRVIGDFVWAGMDYLGEVGVGAWEYADYASRFDGGKGWVSAGSGRIDLTGKALVEMAYMQVAYEMRKIAVGVVPVNHTGDRHSPSAWKMTNAVESWSFEGYEGETAKVEVYTKASYVELYLNGTLMQKKKVKKNDRVLFRLPYQNGILQAKAYNEQGEKVAEQALETAGKGTVLRLEPELSVIKRDSQLCYVRIRYTDEKGILKPLMRDEIQIEAVGGEVLGLGSACPYYEKNYRGNIVDTYYGEAMVIIEPGEAEQIMVKAVGTYGQAEVCIRVE